MVLVVAAFVVPHLHLGIVTPLINSVRRAALQLRRHRADLRVVERARRVGHAPGDRHRRLPPCWWGQTGCAAAYRGAQLPVGDVGDRVRVGVLAGHDRRLAARLRRAGSPRRHEYLRQVPTVTDIPDARTHVRQQNPRLPTEFVDHPRVGASARRAADVRLAGPHRARRWRVGRHCCACWSAPARPPRSSWRCRALADESTARLAAPFVAVAPTAIWIAVSADGYFAGVAAWGIALLALAVPGGTAPWPVVAAAGSGLLLGWGIFLNYGLGTDGGCPRSRC